MYAIFQTGGKQYKVEEGDLLDVELLEGEGPLAFKEVLFINKAGKIKIGAPHVKGALVLAERCGTIKGEKKIAFKYKRSHNYRRKVGHRQKHSRIKITGIKG